MRTFKNTITLAIVGLFTAPDGSAQGRDPETIPLYSGAAPGAQGNEVGDKNNPGDIPTLAIYLPDPAKATGAAVVVCPGGGYGFLAVDHEGKDVAEWLNSVGVAAFVLKYRLGPKYHHPAPLNDAQRALRLVRARADEWKIDPTRVAVLGFSAGGHLASTAATHFDSGDPAAPDPVERQSCRPDLAILIYPVIALATPQGHKGSLQNLLGENPPIDLIYSLSNETQVTDKTPPTFLAHTNEDEGVPAENAILFAMALRKAKVPVEFHLFEKGKHGLGLGTGWAEGKIEPLPSFQAWPKLCETWMRDRGFLKRP
jgi:acetyl esterase/lipase